MKLLFCFASFCRNYTFFSTLSKTKSTLNYLPNYANFHKVNQWSALTVSASTFYASFHICAPLFAKRFQDRENEYAHSIMSSIDSYNNSTLKYPLTLKNGPLDSNSDEIFQAQELIDFSKEKEGEFHSEQLIFVYGSLKRNEPNHDLVSDSSKGKAIFVGMGRTVQKFPLVIASRYNIPFLLHKEGVGKNVIGELYKVDDDMLDRMDELECNGKYYRRIKIDVQPFIPEKDRALPIVKPWVYFLINYKKYLLDLPHLENYSSDGPHGLKFVSRNNRNHTYHYSQEVQNKEDESDSEELIFVYGTLKRNEPNHDLITDSSKGRAVFEAMGRTVEKFPLVIASRYNVPYLLQKDGVGKHVTGELYLVDKDMLERMDELESNGKYYNRMKVEVQTFIPDNGDHVSSIVKPWVYFLMNYREHLLDLPHLENYSSKGSHGLEYVSRHNRPNAEDYSHEVQNKKEDESGSEHLIFVYGTLKRNEPNHDLVTDSTKGQAIFVGMGRTVLKFPLVIASRYNIPYLLYKEGVGKHVIGELYKIDEKMLETMDELECNGKYYNRIRVEVQPFIPEDGDRTLPIVKPWIYFLVNFREHLLNLPYLENYSSKGPHGLEYVSRYKGPLKTDYYCDIKN